jgi:MFS family permease
VVAWAQLVDEAMQVGEHIVRHSPPVIVAINEAVNRKFESSLSEGLLFERRLFHAGFSLADQKEGMATSWKAILVAMFGAQGGTSVSRYTSIVYMLYFLQNVLKVDPARANLCLGVAIVVAAPFYPVFGRLSDAIGRARTMLVGIVLWILAAYPVFAGIRANALAGGWTTVTLLVALLAVLTAMIMAPLPAFIAECFPPQSRTTGFGLSQQLGNVLFGGFLPLIGLSLVNLTGNPLAGGRLLDRVAVALSRCHVLLGAAAGSADPAAQSRSRVRTARGRGSVAGRLSAWLRAATTKAAPQ